MRLAVLHCSQRLESGVRPGRVGLALLAIVAFHLRAVTPAVAQTVFTATDGASLVSALTTIDNHPNTSHKLNFPSNITLAGAITLPAINTTRGVTINGGGFTRTGGRVQRGFFVYSGTVSINSLTIQNAVAQRGSGGIGVVVLRAPLRGRILTQGFT